METTVCQDHAVLQASAAKCTWRTCRSSYSSGAGVSCCFRTAASKNYIIPFTPQRQSRFNGTITSSTFGQACAFMAFGELVLTACAQTYGHRGLLSLPARRSGITGNTNPPWQGVRSSLRASGRAWQGSRRVFAASNEKV